MKKNKFIIFFIFCILCSLSAHSHTIPKYSINENINTPRSTPIKEDIDKVEISTKEESNKESITSWILNNKSDFEKVIKESAIETKTSWIVLDEKTDEVSTETKPSNTDNKRTHKVVRGDTLYSISKTYDISQEEILQWNKLLGPQDIKIGIVIKLYDDQSERLTSKDNDNKEVVTKEDKDDDFEINVSSEFYDDTDVSMKDLPEYSFYKVKKGDSFVSIAKKHRMKMPDFMQLNNFDKDSVLSVDQIVKVKRSYTNIDKEQTKGIVKDGFDWPVVGRLLVSFGTQQHGVVNEGINIQAKLGTDVKATQKGIVIYVGDNLRSFGNLILIQHDEDWISAYAHVDNIQVEKGSQISKGQVIASVGNTGDVSTPQLHFELRHKVKPVDPLNYLASYR